MLMEKIFNDLRSFNEIFRKGATYDNVKSHKKAGPNPLSRRYTFQKTTGRRVKLAPSPPTV